MARILICHVPKDGSIAREVGSALMGRGHFVSFDGEPDVPREDRSGRLRQFEAVVVIWTDASVQSAALAAIAEEAFLLSLVVPVRAPDLAVARLPLTFRKLNMVAPRDIDGMARVVARLSTAVTSRREMSERENARREKAAALEREAAKRAAAEKPAPPAPVVESAAAAQAKPLADLPEVEADALASPLSAHREATAFSILRDRADAAVATADDLQGAVDAGLLVQDIPEMLERDRQAMIVFTLGPDILSGLVQPAVAHLGGGERQAIETLSISLFADPAAFEIERQSERTQFVNRKMALASDEPETFGRWMWRVTPLVEGTHDLVVRISALLRDDHGVPAPVALPDRRVPVAIVEPEEDTMSPGLVAALAGWYRR